MLPIAVVLTIPAAGSEASKNTVISNDALGMKTGYGNEHQRPKLAFMNPELTFTLPPYQTAAGITDMFCHLLERFFDDVGAVPVTDNLALSLMRTVRAEAPRVLADPEDYEARANIMWAGMLCHQGARGRRAPRGLGDARPRARAVGLRHLHHPRCWGTACLFPAWMEHVHAENPARLAYYGREVFVPPPRVTCAPMRFRLPTRRASSSRRSACRRL